MRSLRVIHVAASLEPHAGSLALSIRDLPSPLAGNGIESVFLVADSSESAVSNARCVSAGNGQAAGEIRQADVVHFHGWDSTFAHLAKSAKRAGKPFVVSPFGSLTYGPYRHQNWKDKFRSWLGESALIRSAACLTAANRAEVEDLRTGRQNNDIRVLQYGMSFDTDAGLQPNAEQTAANQGPCLLFLGPIHPVEGIVPFLKAIAELGRVAEPWDIVIAGPEVGDWRKMLESAVRRKGASDRVRFTPARDEAAHRALLARASIVVVPALHTRAPVSLMQAVAAGVPVVTTTRAAIDILADVTEVCDATRDGLRNALQSLMKLDAADLAELGSKAREAGRLLIDWPVAAKNFEQLYRHLA